MVDLLDSLGARIVGAERGRAQSGSRLSGLNDMTRVAGGETGERSWPRMMVRNG
jgi:hypothetical protein